MYRMQVLTLPDIHAGLLEILKDIDAFCRREGITYALGYGTLLGAVRYGDFIPWDDDADLIMPRKDFDRFVATYPRDGRFHCLLNTVNDTEYYVSGFAKVHDPSTQKYIGNKKVKYRYGISVDIFPLDPLPEDPEERHSLIKRAMHCHRRLRYTCKCFPYGSPLLMLEAHLRGRRYWWKKCMEAVHSVAPDSTSLYGVMMGATSFRNVHPKTLLDNPSEIVLAGHSFLCPADTNAYLTQIYGPDYITPPPESERTGHGGTVYRI